jgi:hypothetical protein
MAPETFDEFCAHAAEAGRALPALIARRPLPKGEYHIPAFHARHDAAGRRIKFATYGHNREHLAALGAFSDRGATLPPRPARRV